jgi:hypothetical protein
MNKFALKTFILTGFLGCFITDSRALDIGPMKWSPRADWINVKLCTAITGGANAVGDGVTDDTAPLKGIFKWLGDHRNGRVLTVYFPPGTYKLTDTLTMNGFYGVSLLGCGSDTIIRWAGPKGGAMIQTMDDVMIRQVGFVWDGNNLASCAYLISPGGGTQNRHENESFKNFNQPATYAYVNFDNKTVTSPAPPTAAILAGNGLSSEVMVYNCCFSNCTTGLIQGWQVGNNLMWDVDGCEFDDCGTGINYFTAACMTIANTHFSRSKVADIIGGHQMHVTHCTSTGSHYFYSQLENVPFSPDVIEDCHVDGWTDVDGAVFLGSWGPNMVFDCVFTHPPADGQNPVCLDRQGALTTSNNVAEGSPGVLNLSKAGSSLLAEVPPGARGGTLTSASQTFLKTNYPSDGSHIIDVTQPPYSADKNYGADAAPAIQSAINAAKTANNGSVVYIPTGLYKITSTLKASGSNYSIQGNGYSTELCWFGPDKGTMMLVSNPQNLSVQLLRFASMNDTVVGLKEVADGPSNAVYDEIHYIGFHDGNPGAGAAFGNGAGILLSGLPAGSKVYMPHEDSPLVVENSSAAQILTNFIQLGTITVSGVSPKTGFLGIMIAEGTQVIPGEYNIVVKDDQDLVVGGYYTEQGASDLSISRGAGTGSGQVAIQGFSGGLGTGNTTRPGISINADNYQGSLYYGMQYFLSTHPGGLYPVEIQQAGDNPLSLILPGNVFIGGPPKMTTQAGTHLIAYQNVMVDSNVPTDLSNATPASPADYRAVSQALDHFRQLEAVDLSVQYGIHSTIETTAPAEAAH